MARIRLKQGWEAAKPDPVEFEGASQDSREGEAQQVGRGTTHCVCFPKCI